MNLKSSPTSRKFQRARKGSVIIIVLWTIAVAALITASVQLFSHRQATIGRESIQRVQARWAARAGFEEMLAIMSDHTQKPYPDDARAMVRDMYYRQYGELAGSRQQTAADYTIVHHIEGNTYGGPMDEHSKINVNRTDDRGLLMVFDDISLDIIDAVGDWMDEDDDISTLGVERDYYLGLSAPYLPRNGPMRCIGEMELVAGVWPRYFRGEDWNLNNRMDPNENDSAWSFPADEPDDLLDVAWAGKLTVYSVAGGATASGLPRIRLKDATTDELEKRLGVNTMQATSLIQYGTSDTNVLSDLLTTPLALNANQNQSGSGGNAGAGGGGEQGGREAGAQGEAPQTSPERADLSDAQLRAVFAECCIEDPLDRVPGKMNLNTVSAELLRDIVDLMNLDEAIADEIIYMRSARPQGIASLVDLKSIPNISAEDLRAISRRFDTTSNVFTVTSRGRSRASGLEVEIVAVVDRSTVPVRILEYREQ